MANGNKRTRNAVIEQRVSDAIVILKEMGFGPKQSNELAAYVVLAMLGLKPTTAWSEASNPLMGITPTREFINEHYRHKYAHDSRESIRDEAVKYFVEYGMLLRNPDAPSRPTNSGKTVYQIEPSALALFQAFGTSDWTHLLADYLSNGTALRHELQRHRSLAMVPVRLPDGSQVTLSPGGQNPLIKQVVEEFCPRYVPDGVVVYLGDTADKFQHMDADYLAALGIVIDSAAKIPDVVIHDTRRGWLILIEAVTTAGPVDGKRRKELKSLFANARVGLVFVTAFESRKAMQSFCSVISWESEVWVAQHPDHLIHFNGERYLGPYPDVMPGMMPGHDEVS